jgi:hypothetical protein
MNHPPPREVADQRKAEVLTALKDPNGYRIYKNGRGYLRRLGFDPLSVVVDDLVDYLEEGCRLYVLPDDPRKCECCLRYEDDLVIHVKITPCEIDGRFIVYLGFHDHDTGYPPLPS